MLADPNAASNGYLFSRALAQSIYGRNNADGIVFPSVKDHEGFNIGVKAAPSDRSFHNVCCIVTEIRKIRKYGVIEYEIIKSAETLEEDNNFVWNREEIPGIIGIYGMNKEEYDLVARNSNDKNNLLNLMRYYHDQTYVGFT